MLGYLFFLSTCQHDPPLRPREGPLGGGDPLAELLPAETTLCLQRGAKIAIEEHLLRLTFRM